MVAWSTMGVASLFSNPGASCDLFSIMILQHHYPFCVAQKMRPKWLWTHSLNVPGSFCFSFCLEFSFLSSLHNWLLISVSAQIIFFLERPSLVTEAKIDTPAPHPLYPVPLFYSLHHNSSHPEILFHFFICLLIFCPQPECKLHESRDCVCLVRSSISSPRSSAWHISGSQ